MSPLCETSMSSTWFDPTMTFACVDVQDGKLLSTVILETLRRAFGDSAKLFGTQTAASLLQVDTLHQQWCARSTASVGGALEAAQELQLPCVRRLVELHAATLLWPASVDLAASVRAHCSLNGTGLLSISEIAAAHLLHDASSQVVRSAKLFADLRVESTVLPMPSAAKLSYRTLLEAHAFCKSVVKLPVSQPQVTIAAKQLEGVTLLAAACCRLYVALSNGPVGVAVKLARECSDLAVAGASQFSSDIPRQHLLRIATFWTAVELYYRSSSLFNAAQPDVGGACGQIEEAQRRLASVESFMAQSQPSGQSEENFLDVMLLPLTVFKKLIQTLKETISHENRLVYHAKVVPYSAQEPSGSASLADDDHESCPAWSMPPAVSDFVASVASAVRSVSQPIGPSDAFYELAVLSADPTDRDGDASDTSDQFHDALSDVDDAPDDAHDDTTMIMLRDVAQQLASCVAIQCCLEADVWFAPLADDLRRDVATVTRLSDAVYHKQKDFVGSNVRRTQHAEPLREACEAWLRSCQAGDVVVVAAALKLSLHPSQKPQKVAVDDLAASCRRVTAAVAEYKNLKSVVLSSVRKLEEELLADGQRAADVGAKAHIPDQQPHPPARVHAKLAALLSKQKGNHASAKRLREEE